jgi:hypothetical protein
MARYKSALGVKTLFIMSAEHHTRGLITTTTPNLKNVYAKHALKRRAYFYATIAEEKQMQQHIELASKQLVGILS